MKRFIITFMAFFFSICMIVPLTSVAISPADEEYQFKLIKEAHNDGRYTYDNVNEIKDRVKQIQDKVNGMGNGASQESIEELKESVNNINVEQGIEDFVNKKNEELAAENEAVEGETETNFTVTDSLFEALNLTWGALPDLLSSSVDDPTWQITLDPQKQYNGSFYAIFVTIGYSLVLVFFAANLIETTIKYEIFTLKGGVQIFGRLIVSKVIIDLSGKICIFILNICENICTKIMENASAVLKFSKPNVFSAVEKNTVWPIGPIIDVIVSLVIAIPIIIIILLMLVAVALIMIKLILRSIELSLLIIVSPAFFACYSSEITKPYFKNFILTFLQCSLQVVFMSIVYALSADWMTRINTASTAEDIGAWIVAIIPNILIALAIAIMMIKPPKVLTSLVR